MKNTIAILLLLCGTGARAQTPYVPTCLTPAQITTVTQSTAALAPILLFDETDAALRLADQQCANVKTATGLLADVAQAKASISSHEARITKLEAVASPNLTSILADIATLKQQVQALQSQPPPALAYGLSVSVTPDRLNATDLNGAAVKGLVYIFTAARSGIQNINPAGVGTACYMLDGTAIRASCETQTPYDFIGGSVTVALPWASTTVPNGTHTITQKVTTLAGTTETDIATFTVAN